jgi:hypothetical protein
MIDVEKEGFLILRNVGEHLPNDTASHSGKHESSAARL